MPSPSGATVEPQSSEAAERRWRVRRGEYRRGRDWRGATQPSDAGGVRTGDLPKMQR